MTTEKYGNEDSFNDAPRETSQYELPRGGAVEPNKKWKPLSERSKYAQRKAAKSAAKHASLIASILHSQKMERLSQLF